MHMRSYLLILAATFLACGATASEEGIAGYEGYWLDVVATAYSPHDDVDSHYHETKGERWRWITADGKTDVRWSPYGIAVPLLNGKPALPFGTQIIIPTGYGYVDRSVKDRAFKVDDVGNGHQYFKRKDGALHIDLRYMSHASAIEFVPDGFKKMRVFVVTGVTPPPSDRLVELRHELFWDPTMEPKTAR